MGGKEIEKIVEMLRDSIEEKIGPYSDAIMEVILMGCCLLIIYL